MSSILNTCIIILVCCASLLAQTNDSLRIGLVLSGGGAKGYAHIGVLKVLEEAGVRIDQIGGTSMGAIVGGLYACGYSAAQIEDIFRNLDPASLIFEEQARWSKSFFERENGEKYALSLSVDDLEILFPTALSSGQLLYDQLAQLTLDHRHLRDFSELPIPFLCVATNLETGAQVVLEEGYLVDALRASGSFPTLLAPIEIDGKLLSDGGIANNFPVAEVKAKGPDIIIGVSVEDGLYAKEELNSVLRIVEQIGSFRMAENSRKQQQLCDLLIQPDITGFNVTSFEAIDTLIAHGERAAREQIEALVELASRQGQLSGQSDGLQSMRCGEVRVSAVEIGGGHHVPSPIEGFWSPDHLSPFIDGCEFFKGIHQLRSSGFYQAIRYSFEQTDREYDRVTLIPVINNGYRRSLKIGLHYDDVYGAGLLVNVSARQVGVREGLFSLDVVAGSRFRSTLNYIIDRGRQPSPGFRANVQLNEFRPGLPASLFRTPAPDLSDRVFRMTDLATVIDLRLYSNSTSALGVDFATHWFDLCSDPTFGSDETLRSAIWYFTTSGYIKVDNRDASDIPSSGWLVNVHLRPVLPLATGGDIHLSKSPTLYLDTHWERYSPVGRQWNLQTGGRIGLVSGEPVPPFYYYLGGFNRNFINHFTSFPGLAFSESTGSRLLTAYLRVRRQVGSVLYLQAGVQAAWLDTFSGGPPSQWTHLQSVMASVILDTAIGPLQLTYGGTSGVHQIYLNFGHWF